MKKITSLALVLAMLLSLMVGCGSGSSSAVTSTADSTASGEGSTAEATETSSELDTSTFLVIADENPDIVDPQCTTAYYTVALNIFDRLVEIQANDDGTSEIIPSLAKSWDVSDDGLTYTFTLEEGVKYTNGADLTASDVLYTITRMLTYEKAVSDDIYDMIVGAEELMNGEATELSGFEIIDDYNFTITLTQPYAAFLACLATPGASIFDEETTEAAGDQFGIDPAVTIGTGPFILYSWTVNSELILVANEDCWSGAPACDGVITKFIDDESTLRMMFENGELDILDFDYATTQLDYFLENEEYADQIISGARVGINYICLNQSIEPLNDVNVRKALQYSIDRQAILDALYSGLGYVENGIFPHGLVGYNADLAEIPYDVELAKELLAEAGYADGFEMEICFSSDTGTVTKNLLEIVAAQWSEIGVNCTLKEVDSGSYADMRAAGELMSYKAEWSADFNDPDNFIYTFFGNLSNATYRGFGYTDEEIMARVSAARGIVDDDERIAEYQELEEILIQEEACWIPLFSRAHVFVVSERVSGFTVSWNGWSSTCYRNVSVSAE